MYMPPVFGPDGLEVYACMDGEKKVIVCDLIEKSVKEKGAVIDTEWWAEHAVFTKKEHDAVAVVADNGLMLVIIDGKARVGRIQ